MEHKVCGAKVHEDVFDRVQEIARAEDSTVSMLLKRALVTYALKQSGDYLKAWQERYGTASKESCGYILDRANLYHGLAKQMNDVKV